MASAEYQKRRYQKQISRAISYLGGKCSQCGSTTALEFDHKNPIEKSFKISDMTNRSWEAIQKELDKCQLLCKPCHADKTKADRAQGHKLSGEQIGTSKLTESQVREIKTKRNEGSGIRELGRLFGVSHVTISRIISEKSWSKIKPRRGEVKG